MWCIRELALRATRAGASLLVTDGSFGWRSAKSQTRGFEPTALSWRFVDGPVIVLPRPRTAGFVTTGMVPMPGGGTVIPTYRTTAEWGTLEAESVLMSADRTMTALPAPASPAGPTVKGEGCTLTLVPGWTFSPAPAPATSS